MSVRLKDIATIQSGIYLKNEPEGDVFNLQVKDFNSNHQLADKETLKPTLTCDDRITDHLLTDGNLLFASKGAFNFCAVYHSDMGKVVASSSFLVIRIKDKQRVYPDYIAWFLNHPQTQQYLKLQAKGTSIPSISKATIEEIKIPLPPPEKQKLITNLADLQKREKQLRNQITRKREDLVHHLLMRALTE